MAEGASEPALSTREVAGQVAEWVIGFLAPSYGPRGGTKLIEQPDGSGRLVKSGASALRECGLSHPHLQAYVDLAQAVAQHAGDQATGSVLLAARLIRAAVANTTKGLPVIASMEGYQLALRQVRARLATLARPDSEGRSLAAVVPDNPHWAQVAWSGARSIAGPDGSVPLDSVDVRSEGAADGEWLAGLVVEPQFTQPTMSQAPRPVKVLLVTEEWKPGPWRDGISYRMTADHALASWSGAEDARRDKILAHVRNIGATFVACSREIDPEVAGRLAQAGVTVWNDAPLSAFDRIERATGAKRATRLDLATAADLGTGTLARRSRRQGGHLLSGAGPGSTFVVGGATASAAGEQKDQAERLLRACGLLLHDPVALPGGGRWQRALAQALRDAAPAAPGKSPLAIAAAAQALDALADDLLRSFGLDVLDGGVPPGADGVTDPAGPVRVAVVAAFEMALQSLRIDDHYVRRESGSTWLRGSKNQPESLREMAGDVPTDM